MSIREQYYEDISNAIEALCVLEKKEAYDGYQSARLFWDIVSLRTELERLLDAESNRIQK